MLPCYCIQSKQRLTVIGIFYGISQQNVMLFLEESLETKTETKVVITVVRRVAVAVASGGKRRNGRGQRGRGLFQRRAGRHHGKDRKSEGPGPH